jgi:hypothetical protein
LFNFVKVRVNGTFENFGTAVKLYTKSFCTPKFKIEADFDPRLRIVVIENTRIARVKS